MMDNYIVSEPLRRLLKVYEISALNSLRGPSFDSSGSTTNLIGGNTSVSSSTSSLSPVRPYAEGPLTVEKAGCRDSLLDVLAALNASKNYSAAAHLAAQPLPVMMPRDHSTERHETLLEGEIISCFVVGGEKRLCLPQVLNAVLRDYSLQEINRACADLHVHCSQCSKDQLDVLKINGVLPLSAANCGLITKTDAERLCNYLSHSRRSQRQSLAACTAVVNSSAATTTNEAKEDGEKRRFNMSLPVYHECFGRCRGRYHQTKYTSLSAECIECEECGELYAPDRFVLHSHRNHETKTCHWGFDSANWRSYLHLALEIEDVTEAQRQLENMKAKFFTIGGVTTTAAMSSKRPLDLPAASTTFCPQQQLNWKRARYEHPMVAVDCAPSVPPTNNIQMPIPTMPNPLPSLILCDPLLLAYYHALANSRLGSMCPSNVYPNDAQLNQFVHPFATEKFSADIAVHSVEEAAAALLKLSPTMHSKNQVNKCPESKSELKVEPFKKQILHRSSLKLDSVSDADNIDNKMKGESCADEDVQSIDALLRQYVSDEAGLKLIQAKLNDTRRRWDGKLDSIFAQNRILQQEIAFTRSKDGSSIGSCGSSSSALTA